MRHMSTAGSRRWGRIVFALALLALWAAFVVNWQSPTVRLSVGRLNPLAFLLAMTLPTVALVAAWWPRGPDARTQRVRRGVAMALCLPAIVVSAPLMLLAALDFAVFPPVAHDPIDRVALGSSRVVVYRTDGGATTAYGILVRQEQEILPGVLRVAELATAYPAARARVEVLDGHRVRVTIEHRRPRILTLPLATH
jgi:hypothetical protein